MTKARDFFRAFFLVPKPRFIPSDGAVCCIPRQPKGVVRDASGPRPTPEAARTPPYGVGRGLHKYGGNNPDQPQTTTTVPAPAPSPSTTGSDTAPPAPANR